VVRFTEGQLFKGGKIYDLDETLDYNLLDHVPTTAGDTRYVALLARGIEEDVPEDRFIEIDADTEEKVPVTLPLLNRRRCYFVPQPGIASPAPIKPSVDAAECVACYVLMGNGGILAVEPSEDHRVKTLFEVEGRVTVLEAKIILAFERTQTLETDLANLQGQLKDFARADIVRQNSMDMARVRRILSMPSTMRANFYDPGLVKTQWSLTHVDWDARVDEGIRMPHDASEDVRLAVQNPAQDGIRITDNVLMLDWDEVTPISIDGNGSTKDISQIVHIERRPVRRSVRRSSVSYGPTVAMCGNTSEYSGFDSAASGQTFQKSGETFQKVAAIDPTFTGDNINLNDFNKTHGGGYDVDRVILHNSQSGQTGNRVIYGARKVQVNTWTDTYWSFVEEEFGINGSVYAQSFLLTQPSVLTGIRLKFERVDDDGEVKLLLCEIAPTGEPLFDRVIANTEVTADKISKGWVTFPFTPKYLEPKRYAWVTITTGNHSIRTVTGAQYAEGTLFWSTDQAWFQGSPEEDFCFQIVTAQFKTTRTQVIFDSLSLPGGMTEIKLLYENWSPDGTSMIWEVRTSGEHPWEMIQPETAEYQNPLRNLPSTCQLRLTMIGTNRLSPAIILNENARGETFRHKHAGAAVTCELMFGLWTQTPPRNLGQRGSAPIIWNPKPVTIRKIAVFALSQTASLIFSFHVVSTSLRMFAKTLFFAWSDRFGLRNVSLIKVTSSCISRSSSSERAKPASKWSSRNRSSLNSFWARASSVSSVSSFASDRSCLIPSLRECFAVAFRASTIRICCLIKDALGQFFATSTTPAMSSARPEIVHQLWSIHKKLLIVGPP
jgi:hypothetical protein